MAGLVQAAGDIGQRQRIGARPAARFQDVIIASNFPLDRKLTGNPPDCRMKKQRRLDELLRQISPIIAPLQVRQLVSQHVF